jgi:phage baseplate assembly protein W
MRQQSSNWPCAVRAPLAQLLAGPARQRMRQAVGAVVVVYALYLCLTLSTAANARGGASSEVHRSEWAGTGTATAGQHHRSGASAAVEQGGQQRGPQGQPRTVPRVRRGGRNDEAAGGDSGDDDEGDLRFVVDDTSLVAVRVYVDDLEVAMDRGTARRRAARLAQRRAWHHDCLVDADALEHEPAEIAQLEHNEEQLRHHAFLLHRVTEGLRRSRGLYSASASGTERGWIETFARPVRRLLKRTTYTTFAAERPYWRLVEDANASWPLLARALVRVGMEDAPGAGDSTALMASYVVVEEPYDWALFAPFVPIFVAWEDQWTTTSAQTPLFVGAQLLPHLESGVQYVTLAQRHSGLYLQDMAHFRSVLRNVLVLSPGGRGHVPIPLLLRELPVAAQPAWGSHLHTVSFVGTVRPGVRQVVMDATATALGHRFVHGFVEGTGWQEAMSSTLYQLAPRGVGPTSFRLYEAIQLGLVPIYVWEGVRWLPYAPGTPRSAAASPAASLSPSAPPAPQAGAPEMPSPAAAPGLPRAAAASAAQLQAALSSGSAMWDELGFVLHVDDYPAFLASMAGRLATDKELYERKRAAVLRYREAYFTYRGLWQQVLALFDDPRTAELRCVRQPPLTL